MIPRQARSSLGRTAASLLAAFLATLTTPTHGAVAVGGLVVVGYIDNAYDLGSGTADEIAFLATETIAANEEIYITNNGWIGLSSDRSFAGKNNQGDTAAGQENLMKLTINSTIYAGTVLRTSDTSNSAFTWTTSGLIPTGPNGNNNPNNSDEFSMLDLKHGDIGGFTYGDQIYVFQADGVDPSYTSNLNVYPQGVNPLAHPTNFISALHMGNNFDGPGFRPEFDGSFTGGGGAVPDGTVGILSTGSPYYTVAHGLQIGDDSQNDDGDALNDNSAFELDASSEYFNGTFGIDMSASAIANLQTNSGSKTDWMALLADSSNWSSRSDLNFTTFNFSVAPEPSRALLLVFGGAGLMLRRQRSRSAAA